MILLTIRYVPCREQPARSHTDPGAGRTAQTYHNIHENICLQLVRPSSGSWEMSDTIHPARKRTGLTRYQAIPA